MSKIVVHLERVEYCNKQAFWLFFKVAFLVQQTFDWAQKHQSK